MDIKNNPNVALAIPIAVGDNYHGYRLVGTIPEMFEKVEYSPGKHYELEPGGHFFDPTRKEAVVGSFVAQKMGTKSGRHVSSLSRADFQREGPTCRKRMSSSG